MSKSLSDKLYKAVEDYWKKKGKLKESLIEAIDPEQEKIINNVYRKLQNREIHPSGHFDSGGRFYLDNDDLVNVREPSRNYPYSQMVAGRTKKYVKKVCDKYNCKTEKELIHHV